jgi:hypothetical protein
VGLLLELLRALPGAPASVHPERSRGGARGALDRLGLNGEADRLVEQLGVHGLSALARTALSAAGVTLPERAEARLTREALGVKGAAVRHVALLTRTLDALAQKGLTPALLKGHGLGVRVYPEPFDRLASDVDLLIRPDELPAAEAALTGIGLSPMAGPEAAYAREHHHSVNFEAPGQLVELHHRALMGVGHVLGSEALLERSTPGMLEGRAVRFLSPEDELAYLAAHAAGHAFARLSWLYDVKRYIEKIPVDWKLLASRARQARIHGPAYFGLAVARRAAGAQVPDEALHALAPPKLRARLVDALFDEARLEAGYFWTHRYAGYVATPLIASDAGAMARYAAHHVWRGSRRHLAMRFPALAPAHWRG